MIRTEELWSPAVTALMALLDGRSQAGVTARFPPQSDGPLPCSRRELPLLKLHAHLVDDPEVLRFQITDAMFVLCEVGWGARHRIRTFSIQAFVTEGITLAHLVRRSRQECIDAMRSVHSLRTYECPFATHYRCESHDQALGLPFREPYVHIHRELKGEPRFPLSLSVDDNPIVAFLEFLALNHDYETWRAWAHDICGYSGLRAQWRDVERIYQCAEGGEALDALVSAHSGSLRAVRDRLRRARNAPFPWTVERPQHLALTYWT
ncbi:MAG: hypothetical protein R3F65_05835 [bacterium]